MINVYLEPGTQPKVVLYGNLTTSSFSSVFVNGSISSLALRVGPLVTGANPVTLVSVPYAINIGDVVQLFAYDTPGVGDVTPVTFVGSQSNTAQLNKIELDVGRLNARR